MLLKHSSSMSTDYPWAESIGQRGGEKNRTQTKSNMTCNERGHPVESLVDSGITFPCPFAEWQLMLFASKQQSMHAKEGDLKSAAMACLCSCLTAAGCCSEAKLMGTWFIYWMMYAIQKHGNEPRALQTLFKGEHKSKSMVENSVSMRALTARHLHLVPFHLPQTHQELWLSCSANSSCLMHLVPHTGGLQFPQPMHCVNMGLCSVWNSVWPARLSKISMKAVINIFSHFVFHKVNFPHGLWFLCTVVVGSA